MTDFKKLSPATTRRLPIYYRAFEELALQQVSRIKSSELSDRLHIPAATIRHDFSALGELGRSGYGYSVVSLRDYFGQLLDANQAEAIILVGVGNLGQALLANNFRRNPDLNIVAAYDCDHSVIGQQLHGLVVQDIATIQPNHRIHTALLTVPSHAQQNVVRQVEAAGITAIMTFAPKPVAVSPDTSISYLDLTRELQALIFVDNQRHPR